MACLQPFRVLCGANQTVDAEIPADSCRFVPWGWVRRHKPSSVIAGACSARDHARVDSPGLVRPPERVEYGERVEVIPPAGHLASFEREHRDVAVGIGCAGRDNAAF